ncbi:MAG: hypothetical protein SGJ21_02710 [Alphaproteobacteria bacterium]|nr:hypothetical protein [Alphaproteobacteria bacterium]
MLTAAEFRIPWGTQVAAHRMILVANPAGEAVRQLNGLASFYDPRAGCWRNKPIGYLKTDRLRGYDTLAHPHTWLPPHGVIPGSRQLGPAIERGDVRVLAGGLTEPRLKASLDAALEAIRRINALSDGPEGGSGLPYPFMGFGRNSNSVYSTLLSAMGFTEPAFLRPARLNPGAGALLLPKADIEAIRRLADHSSPAITGSRNSASDSAIASTPAAVG